MTLEQKVCSFYNEKKELIEKNYPGINLRKLKRDFYSFLGPCGLSKQEFFTSKEYIVDPEMMAHFFKSLLSGLPLEYLLKKKFFYQSEFLLSPEVLIPRNETELLIEMAISNLNHLRERTENRLRVCDIGTGSGCIALSILRGFGRPLSMTVTDISKKSLEIAEKNYFRLRFTFSKESNCQFFCTDRLKNVKGQFHLIVSNPPYIREEKDRDLVHEQVLQYEPHLALFLKDEQYETWFAQLFEEVYSSLYSGGFFLMEGHENHLFKLKSMAESDNKWKNIEVIKDYCDRNRFLILKK